MRIAMFAACAALLSACAGSGGLLVVSNPSLARMLAMSEKDAASLPPEKRFEWARDRFEIDAADFESALSRNDGDAAVEAAGRLLRFLAVMHSLSAPEQAGRILDIAGSYVSIAESACSGRVSRGALADAGRLRYEATGMTPARLHAGERRPAPSEDKNKQNSEDSSPTKSLLRDR